MTTLTKQNKKGQLLIFGVLFSVIILILGIAFLKPYFDQSTTTYASTETFHDVGNGTYNLIEGVISSGLYLFNSTNATVSSNNYSVDYDTDVLTLSTGYEDDYTVSYNYRTRFYQNDDTMRLVISIMSFMFVMSVLVVITKMFTG